MEPNRLSARECRLMALVCAVVIAVMGARPAAAQSGRATVGNLRIADDSGQTVWEQPAPPGEKVFKAPAGTKQFKVWFEYDGSTTKRAVIKLIAPQGVFIDQKEQQLTAPGEFSIDFTFDEPLVEQEYLVNAYVEVEGAESLSDGLTLLVGDVPTIPASQVNQATVAAPGAPADASGSALNAPADTLTNAPQTPQAGGPSRLLLLGSGLGVIVLLAIVVWAGMSALKQR